MVFMLFIESVMIEFYIYLCYPLYGSSTRLLKGWGYLNPVKYSLNSNFRIFFYEPNYNYSFWHNFVTKN